MEDLKVTAGVREGDVLAGKYRIEKVLGVGGMGVVVAARHQQLDTRVAIKFLLPAMLANAEAVARFAREARAAVRITGEHVARVLDVGTLDTGAPYMVMEFLEGGDLAAWLTQRGALPVDLAVEFLLHACVAVAEAHSLGIVHRDLKPANLFCIRRADGKNSVKVLDFGISKVTTDVGASEAGMSVTKTSAMMGSPLYMSPEQMRSPKEVDAQTDVWALGVILFELLTAQVPFDGETVPEVAIKVATSTPPSIRGLRPEVPLGLEAVIVKALEKPKSDRYRNVAELAIAIGEYAPARAKPLVERICGILQVKRPESMVPDPMDPLPPRPPAVAAATMTAMGVTSSGIPGAGGKRRVAFVAMGVVGAVGVAAMVATMLHKKPDEETGVATATDAPLATSLPAATPTSTPTPASAPAPTTAANPTSSEAHRAELLAPELPPLAPTATTKPPPHAHVHATAPEPAHAPPPAPAPAPASAAQHKNQLDLGNFQ
jgi:eukaryotic-like serine/threonine-protein kinase